MLRHTDWDFVARYSEYAAVVQRLYDDGLIREAWHTEAAVDHPVVPARKQHLLSTTTLVLVDGNVLDVRTCFQRDCVACVLCTSLAYGPGTGDTCYEDHGHD